MTNRATLNLFGGFALAALVTLSFTKTAAAAEMQVGAQPAARLCSTGPAVEASYYHHGHRYPYRYRGHYFYHRRFSGGHWQYS